MKDIDEQSNPSTGSIADGEAWRRLEFGELIRPGDEVDANYGLSDKADWLPTAWWAWRTAATDRRYRRRKAIESNAVPIPPRIQEARARAIREARK